MKIQVGDKNLHKMIQKALFDQLKKAHPIMIKTIKKEIKEVEKEAKKNWPIRQEKYGASQGSRNKFVTGLQVTKDKVVGFVENRAEYAYVIMAGRESNTTVKAGKRVADALMVEPIKKAAKTASKEIADKIIQEVKNG